MDLNPADRSILLDHARQSIVFYLGGQTDVRGDTESAVLDTCCGVFVSLYVEGALRGCIGTFSEKDPLRVSIREMAIASASSDHRFTPIEKSELEQLCIELSVLTPRRRIEDIGDIQPGIHGIYLVKGSHRGTLLPQVALREGWDTETFLRYCAHHKAGLDPDGWKEAEIYVYEAIIINSEKESANESKTM